MEFMEKQKRGPKLCRGSTKSESSGKQFLFQLPSNWSYHFQKLRFVWFYSSQDGDPFLWKTQTIRTCRLAPWGWWGHPGKATQASVRSEWDNQGCAAIDSQPWTRYAVRCLRLKQEESYWVLSLWDWGGIRYYTLPAVCFFVWLPVCF